MCKGSNYHTGRTLPQPLLRYTRLSKAGIHSSSQYLQKCMEHVTEPTRKELSMDSRATGGICRPGELLATRFSHVKCQQNSACPQGCFTCVCTGNHSDSLLRLLRGNKLTVPLGHPVLCVGVCARGALNPRVLPKLSLLISL